MLYICNGHYLCPARSCEHKWTHDPSHINSWRDDCTGEKHKCWSAIDTGDGIYEIGYHCVPYEGEKTMRSLLTGDEELTYNLLVWHFGEDGVIEREYEDEDDGEYEDLEMPEPEEEDRIRLQDIEDMAHRIVVANPFAEEPVNPFIARMPEWVVEEADYNNARGIAVGRYMRGGDGD